MTPTVHRLLHIADTIERIGPVWAWWSFPIERQCGRLQRHITSKHHPFVNLDSHITLAAQFKTTKLIYNITNEDLSLDGPAQKRVGLVLDDECTFNFSITHGVGLTLISDEGVILHGTIHCGHRKSGDYSAAIKSCLFTRYSLKDKKAQEWFWERLPDNFKAYKQATIANGDRVRTADHPGQVEEDTDHRDATFVRVSSRYVSHLPVIQSTHSTRFSGMCMRTCGTGNLCSGELGTSGN